LIRIRITRITMITKITRTRKRIQGKGYKENKEITRIPRKDKRITRKDKRITRKDKRIKG
jgi:hypothetical protein